MIGLACATTCSSCSVRFCCGMRCGKTARRCRIEARRYSRGYHVQQHRSHHPPKADKGVAADWAANGRRASRGRRIGRFTVPRGGHLRLGRLPTPVCAVTIGRASRGAQSRMEVPQPKQPVLLDETLPEPINGYHPNAVPGFILSMGWALGIIGELAVQYLQMPLSRVAIALGIWRPCGLCALAQSLSGIAGPPRTLPAVPAAKGSPVRVHRVPGAHRTLRRAGAPDFPVCWRVRPALTVRGRGARIQTASTGCRRRPRCCRRPGPRGTPRRSRSRRAQSARR